MEGERKVSHDGNGWTSPGKVKQLKKFTRIQHPRMKCISECWLPRGVYRTRAGNFLTKSIEKDVKKPEVRKGKKRKERGKLREIKRREGRKFQATVCSKKESIILYA
jgi:hypothetical protein